MRRVSNDDVMERFKQVAELKDPAQVKQAHDQIIQDVAFLVYANTKRYKKYPNYEDLNQEGFVGLIKATQRFDYRRFPNFFVFANQWIVNGIKRSAKKYDVVYSPKRIRTVYGNEDLLVQDEEFGPDECYCRQEKVRQVRSIVGSLSPRECTIITSLFGLGTNERTLRDTEKCCGLTYERIRQIKNEITDRLKYNQSLIELQD